MDNEYQPLEYSVWGSDFEKGAIDQMKNAMSLPVTVAGALMPDAHQGYGLPIGGVLAVKDAVIPYAVGMDIACRMKMSVLDMPLAIFNEDMDRLKNALQRETRFGVGNCFKTKQLHKVMDENWDVSPITKREKDRAWKQLGTSGGGNHFAEFGVVKIMDESLGLAPGRYMALLTHSGSRGTGGDIAKHYSKVAMSKQPQLPQHLQHLAWLELNSEPGQEYWAAMELMGKYAAANHELIHKNIARNLGAEVLLDIENYHNFAWKEKYNDHNVVVHRKGATPAHKGVVGIIPGSMATPAYAVRGKGVTASLNSASHGAGRKMSRNAAKKQFKWSDIEHFIKQAGVTLISAGIDEAPMAYKDIDEVMAAQAELVEPIAKFDPKLVMMESSKRKR